MKFLKMASKALDFSQEKDFPTDHVFCGVSRKGASL
jgi:hypothetical protein